ISPPPAHCSTFSHAYSARLIFCAISAQCGPGRTPLSQPKANGGKDAIFDLEKVPLLGPTARRETSARRGVHFSPSADSDKIIAMFSAARLVRALLLVTLLCAAAPVFSAASAHAYENKLNSHHPKGPAWTGEVERQSQADSSGLALPQIPGIALSPPDSAPVVVLQNTNAGRRTKEAVQRQRPPPSHSSI